MALTLSAEEFAKRYGASTPVTLSAEEFAKRYGGGTAAPMGDPNAGQPQAGPIRRFLQGAGVPTNMAEVTHMAEGLDPATQLQHGNPMALAGPVGLAAQGIARTVGGEMGTQGGEALAAAQSGDYGGAMRHSLGAAIPLVGPPAAEGDIAGAAGRATSLVAPEAMHRLATAPRTAPPLTESLGQIVASKGRVISPTADIEVPKFNNAARHGDQLSALAEKYPKSDIHDNGQQFVVKAEQTAAPEAPAAAQSPADSILSAVGTLAKRSTIGGAVGGIAGAMVGHPVIGAELGMAAQNAMRNLIQSPLWKTTSGAIKTQVGRAMQAQDFATVTNVAARVLGGENLEDDFGHDKALHGLMQTIGNAPPPELNQALQEYDAVYVQPDGVAIPVPHHVLRQTYNALSSH